MDQFEKDDDVIKKVRDNNKFGVNDIVQNEKEELEELHKLQKRKWMATLPTMLEYYNTGVTNLNNKFIL